MKAYQTIKKKDLRKPSRVKIESMLVNDSKGAITS